jgi:hypothetical protein
MSKRLTIISALLGLTFGIVNLSQGCQGPQGPGGSQGTSTGNPVASVHFASYNPNAKATQSASSLSVQTLRMCFKRLRFKMASSDLSGDELDLDLGDVVLSPNGTDLGDVNVPSGVYKRIEFDLDDHCAGGKSLEVTNAHGSFSTTDGMTIRFDGTFVVDSDSETLLLAIQQIVSALGAVTNDSALRNAAESVDGSF